MPKKRTLYLSIAELKQLGLIKKHLKRKRRRYQKRLVSSSIPSSYNGIKSSSDMQSFGQQINRQNDLENIIKQNIIEKQEKEKRKAEVIDLTQEDTPMKNENDKKSFFIDRTPIKNGYNIEDNIDVSETKGSDYFPNEGINTPQIENIYPDNTDTSYLNRLDSVKRNRDTISMDSPYVTDSQRIEEFDTLFSKFKQLGGTRNYRAKSDKNIAEIRNWIDKKEGNPMGTMKANSNYEILKKAKAYAILTGEMAP